MEPGWLLLFVPTGVVTGLFAWSFGAWRNARATAVLAWIGLAVTVGGVLLAAAVWALTVATASHPLPETPHNGTSIGLLGVLILLLGVGAEWFGACLTLAVCLIGLRQMARRQTGWYVGLLVGALAPIVAVLTALLLWPMIGRLLAQVAGTGGNVWAVLSYGLQLAGILAPLVAAIVTTIYAARAAARARAAQHVPA